MAKAYALTESDRKALAALLDRERRAVRNPQQRPAVPADVPPAPDVYVAWTPADGIPARVGLVLGSAMCDVYRVLTVGGVAALAAAGFAQVVCNLSASAVPGDTPVQVSREKWGTWLVGTAGGGGSCSISTITETDLRCEASGTGSAEYRLNLYHRTRYITQDGPTGCVTVSADDWRFVRAVACCDPTCAEPVPDGPGECCAGEAPLGNPINLVVSEGGGCWTDTLSAAWDSFEQLYRVRWGNNCGITAGLDIYCLDGVWRGYLSCTGNQYQSDYGVVTACAVDCSATPPRLTFVFDPADPTFSGTTSSCLPEGLRVEVNGGAGACTPGGGTGTAVPGTGTAGPGACGITDTGLGKTSNGGSGSVAILAGVTVQAGELLIVNVGESGLSGSSTAAVTFDGTALFQTMGHVSGSGLCVTQFWLRVATTTTGDIVASHTGSGWMALNALGVAGLSGTTPVHTSAGGPGSGNPALPVTTADCSYAAAAFLYTPNVTHSWAPPFISGAQDVSDGTHRLTEAFLVEATGQSRSASPNVTTTTWVGLVGVFT